jgi:xylan 1,4-beta-xylosidase
MTPIEMKNMQCCFLCEILPIRFFFIFGLGLAASNVFGNKTVDIVINPDVMIGEIKAINGGTLSPVADNKILDLREEFGALEIPYVRLHDAPWLNDYVVDIHTIFSNFSLDPKDPKNYDFRKTDHFIQQILETDTRIIFRLGESIEHTDRKYYVNPPLDPYKWVEVCAAIIRHYNRKWADGFSYNIQYWEIWNEPDIEKMWVGSDREFFELFKITSLRIKREFEDISVGGPALSNPLDYDLSPSQFFTDFLKYMKQYNVPLDFLSWHNYDSDPQNLVKRVDVVRNYLNKEGFEETEMHLNEWNYIPEDNWDAIYDKSFQGEPRRRFYEKQSGPEGAAFVASVLILLQDRPVDIVNYYTTTAGLFGIFSDYGECRKTYYAFKAFAELKNKTHYRIHTNFTNANDLSVLASSNEERSRISIMISNFHGDPTEVRILDGRLLYDAKYEIEVYLLDEQFDLKKIDNQTSKKSTEEITSVTIKSNSVMLIKLTNNAG